MTTEEIKINEITIESVNSFLQHISDIREEISENEGEDVGAQSFFFRGQANIDWDITPGIFRDYYLSIESEMVSEAYSRNPEEFRKLDTDFEKLAKLQHYGLPTRLLDVTSNPLVALYFACQSNEEFDEESGNMQETDGVVYFQRAYGTGCTAFEISILSHLASNGIKRDLNLEKLLEELTDKGIFTANAAKDCKNRNYQSLIDVLQSSYFVVSNLNNERLIRQSGSFLFVGKYNIILDPTIIGNSAIQVATSSVRDDFCLDVFKIPAEQKGEILEELDFYNINEGSLFPELEHQMTYIKKVQSQKITPSVGGFNKIDFSNILNEKSASIKNDISDEEIEAIIENVLKESVNKVIFDECKIAITENLSIDWYKKESVLSKIRVALTDVFVKIPMDRAMAKHSATNIVEKILEKIKEVPVAG